MRSRQLLIVVMTAAGVSGCGADPGEPLAELGQAAHAAHPPIGLSLRFVNGQAPALELVGNASRYLQEIDLSEAVPSAGDEGIAPLLQEGAFSELDWSGIAQVEELWIPSLDGTLTRERYFRGARWMNEPSQLKVVAVDENGTELGKPWLARAGRDDKQRPSDDHFVRRFVARQSAFGCASVGDCTGASFVSEALVQPR